MINRLLLASGRNIYINKLTANCKNRQIISTLFYSTNNNNNKNDIKPNNNNNNVKRVILNSTVAGSTTTKMLDTPHIERKKSSEEFKKIKLLSNDLIKNLENENWKLFSVSEKRSMLGDLQNTISDPNLVVSERLYGLIIGYCLHVGNIEDAKYFFGNLPKDSMYFYPFNNILLHYVSKNKLRPLITFFEANIVQFKCYTQSIRFMVFLKLCLKETTSFNGNEIAMKLFNKLLSILEEKDLLTEKVYHHAIGALIHSNRFNDAIEFYNNRYLKLMGQELNYNDATSTTTGIATSTTTTTTTTTTTNSTKSKQISQDQPMSNVKSITCTDESVYFYLFQGYIIGEDLEGCKKLMKWMKDVDQQVPIPPIYFHLLRLSITKGDMEYFNELAHDMYTRGSGYIASMVLVYSYENDKEISKLLTTILDDGICGRDSKITNDSQKVPLLRTADQIVSLFLKTNRYNVALEWYAKRIEHYKFSPNFKNIGYFIIYHAEKHEDDLRDYWIEVLDRYDAHVKDSTFKQLVKEYNDLEPVVQTNFINNFLDIGSGNRPSNNSDTNINNNNNIININNNNNNNNSTNTTTNTVDKSYSRKLPLSEEILSHNFKDESLNRLITETYTRGLGNVMVSYLNKFFLKFNKIPPSSQLIEAIRAIKSTTDARLYMYDFYFPSSPFIRAIIFDPFIYTLLLNTGNSKTVQNFGLGLIYQEPMVIQNLVSTCSTLFGVFLKDSSEPIVNLDSTCNEELLLQKQDSLDMANIFLNKMIVGNKRFYIEDTQSNRENYLKCLLTEASCNKIASLLISDEKVQVYIGNLFLQTLYNKFKQSRSPTDGKLISKYFGNIKEIDMDTIKIYIKYLIFDTQENLKSRKNSTDRATSVITSLFRSDSTIIKNLIASKQSDMEKRLKKSKQEQELKNQKDKEILLKRIELQKLKQQQLQQQQQDEDYEYNNGSYGLHTYQDKIKSGGTELGLDFELPKQKELISGSTIFSISELKNLNEFDLISKVLLLNQEYIKPLIDYLLVPSNNKFIGYLTESTMESILSNSINYQQQQQQEDQSDITFKLFELYHNLKQQQIYSHEIHSILLKSNNINKVLMDSIKFKDEKPQVNQQTTTPIENNIKLVLPPANILNY